MKDVKEILNKLEDSAEIAYVREGLICLEWSLKGVGFGELAIFKQDGEWVMDNETMGKKAAKRILSALADSMDIVG